MSFESKENGAPSSLAKPGLELLARLLRANWTRRTLAVVVSTAVLALALALALRKFADRRFLTSVLSGGVFAFILLWKLPKWQVATLKGLKPEEEFDRENEARKTLSQIIGGLILLIGFYFTLQSLRTTQESLRISSEGQITDRFTKAISQLGDSKMEVRLGGIYALERIATDSPRDHWPIMEVLTAYIRVNAPTKTKLTTEQLKKNGQPSPPPDIQAILTVIGRRKLASGYEEVHDLDLRMANLSGVYLSNADLHDANLSYSYLPMANLNSANLTHATLRSADLRNAYCWQVNLAESILDDADLGEALCGGAHLHQALLLGTHLARTYFEQADLSGAALSKADLRGAKLKYADLRGADLLQADLRGADLQDANLGGADLTDATLEGAVLLRTNLSGAELAGTRAITQSQLNSANGDKTTHIPQGLERPKTWH